MDRYDRGRSKLALAFYVLGGVWLVANVFMFFTAGRAVFALGAMMGAGRGAFVSVLLGLLAQPILIMLFGGVVQVLVDIRDALVATRENYDA